MLRAFRRARASFIRDGKAAQSLRYAFGEFALAVIGIFIALQLSTANQERLSQQRLRESAIALLADLQAIC